MLENKFDLTTSRQYSLSNASRQEVLKLTNPLFITVYYSSDIAAENPLYGKYADFVINFIKQYQRANPNKVFITVKNPEPYSALEKEAKSKGIKSALSSDGQTQLYFGAVFSESEGKEYNIPEFSIDRSFWLEKDITTLISRFNQTERKVIGLISPLHQMIKKAYGTQTESFAVIQELSEEYDILEFPANITEIPPQIEVLIVVAPPKMPTSLSYALDQYVLRGGKLILLVDRHVEEPQYQVSSSTVKKINFLLKNWGVEVSDNLVGSRQFGQKIFMKNNQEEITKNVYPLWLNVSQEMINKNHVITKDLKSLNLRTATALQLKDSNKTIKTEPLISLPAAAPYVPEVALLTKKSVQEKYQPDKENYTLAAWVEGKFQSAYSKAPLIAQENSRPYLYYSAKPTQIFIIGDSDFIRDDVWLQENTLNDNGQLLLKAVDVMNNQSEKAGLHKSQNTSTQKSLSEQIRTKILSRYSAETDRLENEHQALLQEEDRLGRMIRYRPQLLDTQMAEKINKISEKIEKIQQELKFYDFRIRKAFSAQVQSIIFVTMIVLPFILIGTLFIIVRYREKRYCKKIKDKYNAR